MNTKDIKTMGTIFSIVGFVVGVAGVAIVTWQTSWLVALGVMLMLWANNLFTAASIASRSEELVDKFMAAVEKVVSRQHQS